LAQLLIGHPAQTGAQAFEVDLIPNLNLWGHLVR
jgi:hypothetical protein